MRGIQNITGLKKYIYFIALVLMVGLQDLRSQQFKNYPELWDFTSEIPADSAYKIVREANKKALLKKDTTKTISSLIALSAISRALPDYSLAFDYAGEALFLAEEYKNPLYLALANEELGVLNYLFVQNDLAGQNFMNAFDFYKQAYHQKMIPKEEMFYAFFNKVLYYNRINNFEKAYANIDSCEAVVNIHDTEKLYSVYLDEKRAILNSRQGNIAIALNYLKHIESRILDVRPTSQYYRKHHSFLIVVYTSLANKYKQLNAFQQAQTYYEKALSVQDVYKEYTFYLSFVHEEYAELLTTLGEYEKAYKHLKIAKHINDVYLNPRKTSAQGFVKVKNRYTEALNNRNDEISKQNLELAEQKAKILRFRVFAVVLVLLFAVVAFIARSRFQKVKHQKERDLAERQKQHTQDLLEHKNKELTATMLQLIEKEEIIKALSAKLVETNADRGTKNLIASIEKQSTNLWEAFNSRFIEQNKGFYGRLQKKVPDLSSADLKVCALIKLNFSGKEMAHLLGISLGSVHVARHRLRKKMNIERDQNLTKFINGI